MSDKYSAAASALGYLYQIRLALLIAVRKLRNEEPFDISIEALDDIELNDVKQQVLIQAKHRKPGNLTDASSDLWKTLKIWSERIIEDKLSNNFSLFLITTERTPSGSAASFLKLKESRDIGEAKKRLLSTSKTSTSQDNNSCYETFNLLTDDQMSLLLNNITVISEEDNIGDLEKELRKELLFLADNKFVDSVVTRIEGWWLKRTIKQLMESENKILSEEILAEIKNLREQFKSDNLPIDDDILAKEVDASGFTHYIFVKQLDLIDLQKKRISLAVKDYYRAYTQRSRWIREELLNVGEMDKYETLLIEEWERIFLQHYEEIAEDSPEEDIKKIGKQIYNWMETNFHPQIRSGITNPTISRGTYQILSDQLKVGWHKKYEEIIASLNEVSNA